MSVNLRGGSRLYKTGALGKAAYQLSHHAGKYEAKATAARVTGCGEEACKCAAKLANPAIDVDFTHCWFEGEFAVVAG